MVGHQEALLTSPFGSRWEEVRGGVRSRGMRKCEEVRRGVRKTEEEWSEEV